MAIGVTAYIVALIASIMLHEAGHLLTAKRYGMKATQYFLGFGPTLWSFKRGETEYGVKAIPAGGFVKIVGMTDLEDIEPGDESRVFYKQSARKRAVVLAAGSVTHFVLAFIILYAALLAYGDPQEPRRLSTTIDEVSECATLGDPPTCEGQPPSPAKKAGIQPGDRILEFDGRPVNDWATDFSGAIRGRKPGPAKIVVERDGRRLTIPVTLVAVPEPGSGTPPKTRTMIGLQPKELPPTDLGPVSALTGTTRLTGDLFRRTFQGIGALPAAIPKGIKQAFSGKERDPDGIVSPIGIGRVGGQAVAAGEFDTFLGIVAAFNIFIGVMNLLPLLPLDGGHLSILGFEQLRSWWARRRGRRDPGRVDIRKMLPLAQFVVILFASLFLIAFYADISNPLADPFSNG